MVVVHPLIKEISNQQIYCQSGAIWLYIRKCDLFLVSLEVLLPCPCVERRRISSIRRRPSCRRQQEKEGQEQKTEYKRNKWMSIVGKIPDFYGTSSVWIQQNTGDIFRGFCKESMIYILQKQESKRGHSAILLLLLLAGCLRPLVSTLWLYYVFAIPRNDCWCCIASSWLSRHSFL